MQSLLPNHIVGHWATDPPWSSCCHQREAHVTTAFCLLSKKGAQTGNSSWKLRQTLSHDLCVFCFIVALFSVCPAVTWQPQKIVPFGLSKTFSDHWIIAFLASLITPGQGLHSIPLAWSDHLCSFVDSETQTEIVKEALSLASGSQGSLTLPDPS